MASVFGNVIHLSIFGQSHSPAIGCSLDGLPAGIELDLDALQRFLDRRAPGRSDTATMRREADAPEFVAGVTDGRTDGAPLAAIIRNADTRSGDYAGLRRVPRPGHADFPARIKYRNMHDVAGGGHFSGRLTAPLCVAGGIALQALEGCGVRVAAHIANLGPEGIPDEPLNPMEADPGQLAAIASHELPCIDADAASRMREAILSARSELDSIGGVVECAAYGMPAGVGDPMFDGIENRIARIAFGIPAVKGVDFGAGFGAAYLKGSENNDAYRMVGGAVRTETNRAGGILGGITTGAPVVWQMAVKPTPSIGHVQRSVDMDEGADTELTVRGRHDPCIVPRAVPVAEAACALALLDALLEDGRFQELYRAPERGENTTRPLP
ncbi:chorismate synthase [Candidatus Collinsella stercoripullorum]|uniref:chorismate synthase n=1 Tax=Candidatus Collinsella stercoripullorum TaxID=2838522 RepID=UPI0022E349FD|nr:chorismate synthase [Candidatus Collinsella stercoripullorum]